MNLIDSTEIISNTLSKSAEENDKLISAYNDEIKPKLKSIINQHSILGTIIGPLPTMGIATTINLIILYGRLSKVVDIPIIQELDKLIAPAISSTKSAFIKYGAILAVIKLFVTGLDVSVAGAPIGVIGGAIGGFYFSNKSGNIFANNIKNFVNDITKKDLWYYG